jgi:hypothetical protein
MFMEAILFTKNPCPTLSEDKYSIVEQAWKLPIQAQDCQWPLAGALLGTPLVCQWHGGSTCKINPHIRHAVSLEFCLMLFYQTDGY